MICAKCGKELVPGVSFCTSCGTQVAASGHEESVHADHPRSTENTSSYARGTGNGASGIGGFLDGRITRQRWWVKNIVGGVVFFTGLVVSCIVGGMFGCDDVEILGIILWYFIVGTIVRVCTVFSADVRRLHDINQSGWLLVIFWLASFFPVTWLVKLYLLGFLDGTVGPNNYGEDPKGRRHMAATVHVVNQQSNTSFVDRQTDVRDGMDSVEARLKRLGDMKSRGVITNEEYQELRKKTLNMC